MFLFSFVFITLASGLRLEATAFFAIFAPGFELNHLKFYRMDIQNILLNLKIESLNAMQQSMAEAYVKNDSDLILLSPTGSGKTLAYLIPLVMSLRQDVRGVQAVVMVPSRELALQIEQVFKSMGTGLAVMSCYGGRPAMDEHRTMQSLEPSVIVGTPGRMNDHLTKKEL